MAHDSRSRPRNNRSTRGAVLAILALVLGFVALRWAPMAQAQSEEHSGRKVVRTQKPDYPTTLKSAGIGGVVRLNATVLANGTVARVTIIGGNPVLAASAADAVMNWKYAPASATTSEVVTLNFNAH